MRVLCDRHHSDLYYAMQLLFEDRFGFTLHTPVGREWWDEGYWRFGQGFGDDRLAQQFLVTPENERRDSGEIVDGHHPDKCISGVTLGEFRAMGDWRLVVATVPDNQQGFRRLADEVGAKFVVEVGNTGQFVDWSLSPLVINSSEMPMDGPHATVHQEIASSHGGDYEWADPAGCDPLTIRSFVNLTHTVPESWGPFTRFRELLPGFTFASHGHEGPDGFVSPAAEVGRLMRASGWGWHVKPVGDGFGHVIHGWAAVGRPLIGRGSFYRGKMAEPFWQDLVTCVDLDKHPVEEACEIVQEISEDRERHARMCRAMRETFDRTVNYDAEESEVRMLLGL